MSGVGPIAAAFGDLLTSARKKSGKTQEELADLSGLDRTSISQLERGGASPRLETVIRIAGALDMNPRDLVPDVRWKPRTTWPAPAGEFERP